MKEPKVTVVSSGPSKRSLANILAYGIPPLRLKDWKKSDVVTITTAGVHSEEWFCDHCHDLHPSAWVRCPFTVSGGNRPNP